MHDDENKKIAEFQRAAVNRYLIPFCIATNTKWQTNWHHDIIALKLEEALRRLVEENKPTNLIIEVPPRHGKSELASIRFPAWVLGKYPEMPIMIASYASSLAEDFGLKSRDIMEDEIYQAYFKTRLRPDVKARAKWLTMTPKDVGDGLSELTPAGGGYTAAGVGGAITGRGFKIGIVDDPFKNREEADSEVMREKVWEWYKSTFRTRQEGIAIKIIINTRWHQFDLTGKLLDQEEEMAAQGYPKEEIEHWEVIRLPAIADRTDKYRKKGEALWPDKFSLAQLKITENALGPYEFSALYQQTPIPSERQEFKREWFRYFEDRYIQDEIKKGRVFIKYTLTDLAIGDKDENDNTVVRTVGKFQDSPEVYLIEETAGHFDPGQTIDHVFDHMRRHQSVVCALEAVQYQKSLKYFLEERMRKEEFYFNIYLLTRNQGTPKNIRIRGLIPLYRQGLIYHRIIDKELEKELLSFPQGKHDDRPDALANMLEVIFNTTRSDDTARSEPPPPISDYQGTADKVPEDDGMFDGTDIGTLGHGKAKPT